MAKNLVLVKEKMFENQEKFESYIKEAELRRNLNNNYICPLRYLHSEKQNEWCSSFFKVKIAFEFHEMSLDKLLREMKTSQEPTQIWFDQDEAWKFLEDFINILRAFSMMGVNHGDLQPSNIFVENYNDYDKQ